MSDLARKKICYICHPYTARTDTGRGHDRYAKELISRVKERGIACDIWEADFAYYGAGGTSTAFKGVVEEIIFPLKFTGCKADLFHATSPIGGKTAALLNKHPLVTTILDVIHLHIKRGYDLPLKYRYKAWCIELAARKSDRVITIFHSTKESLISKFNLPPDKVKVIPVGVDRQRFFPSPQKPSPVKKVVFIGEAARSKGVDTLIKAFSIVVKEVSTTELLIGSEGRDLGFLKRLSFKLGLNNKVSFFGFIPEDKLQPFYAQADIACFPSHYGFGLPTLEAMACGIPTISGATLDAPEFVKDAGILVKPGEAQQLAEAILKILQDPSLAKELSSKGIERARTFTWEQTAEETIQLYKEILM